MTIEWMREHYGDDVKVGAGNVVDARGLPLPGRRGRRLCEDRHRRRLHLHHPRDQGHRPRPGHRDSLKWRRPATSTSEETGVYVPICSDGGIVHDYHITLALAMGADFVMLGRYFARFDESPTNQGAW